MLNSNRCTESDVATRLVNAHEQIKKELPVYQLCALQVGNAISSKHMLELDIYIQYPGGQPRRNKGVYRSTVFKFLAGFYALYACFLEAKCAIWRSKYPKKSGGGTVAPPRPPLSSHFSSYLAEVLAARYARNGGARVARSRAGWPAQWGGPRQPARLMMSCWCHIAPRLPGSPLMPPAEALAPAAAAAPFLHI